jgi:hypothetical protein
MTDTDDTTGDATNIAAIRAQALAIAGMTDAEFDFSLAMTDGRAMVAMNEATRHIANAGHPAVKPGDGNEVLQQRAERAEALWAQLWPEIEEMATRATGMKFNGWSTASGGPVRYAR